MGLINNSDRSTDRQAKLDRLFMDQALAAACAVPGRTWPNPPVGAVVVKDDRVVGVGAHCGPGQLHAEPVALALAGDQACGATLYVTLEPCNHQGRTAPCAPAVHMAGITRVVMAVRDPNPTVAGGGYNYLRENGIECSVGLQAAQALEMIWPFVTTDNFTSTYLELKTATSMDDRFAPAPNLRSGNAEPFYLTGAQARADVHNRRSLVDLVLVGEGTVRADQPRLDCRLANKSGAEKIIDPLPGYIDTDLSWSGGFKRDHYLVFAGDSARNSARSSANRLAIEKDGGEILFCAESNGHVSPAALLETGRTRGINSIMLEGGPQVAAAFLGAGLVNRWLRYAAPVVLGEGIGWPEIKQQAGIPDKNWSRTSTLELGGDLLTIYDKRNFAEMLALVKDDS